MQLIALRRVLPSLCTTLRTVGRRRRGKPADVSSPNRRCFPQRIRLAQISRLPCAPGGFHFRAVPRLEFASNAQKFSCIFRGGGFTGSEICFRFSEPNSRKNFGEENEFGCFTRRSYTWTMRLWVSLDHLGISNVRRNHGVEIDGGRTDSVHLGNGRGKCQPYLPISQRILARRTKGERVTKRIIFQLRQNFI